MKIGRKVPVALVFGQRRLKYIKVKKPLYLQVVKLKIERYFVTLYTKNTANTLGCLVDGFERRPILLIVRQIELACFHCAADVAIWFRMLWMDCCAPALVRWSATT